jgi:hypothetical protein
MRLLASRLRAERGDLPPLVGSIEMGDWKRARRSSGITSSWNFVFNTTTPVHDETARSSVGFCSKRATICRRNAGKSGRFTRHPEVLRNPIR